MWCVVPWPRRTRTRTRAPRFPEPTKIVTRPRGAGRRRLRDATSPLHLELRRFTLDRAGRLTPSRTTYLRGGYTYFPQTLRVVGDQLLLHTQSPLGRPTADILGLPAIWRAGRWRRLLDPSRIQRPISRAASLHTRLRCDLDSDAPCVAAGLVAPPTAFVQADDEAFVAWTTTGVWRIPFADAPATVVRTTTPPLDLLAWRLERGSVDAVVHTAADELATLHIPAADLRAGLSAAPPARPIPRTAQLDVAARFIGPRLLHGDLPDWACQAASTLHVREPDGSASAISIPHCISRIEPAGDHALVISAPHKDPLATHGGLRDRPHRTACPRGHKAAARRVALP